MSQKPFAYNYTPMGAVNSDLVAGPERVHSQQHANQNGHKSGSVESKSIPPIVNVQEKRWKAGQIGLAIIIFFILVVYGVLLFSPYMSFPDGLTIHSSRLPASVVTVFTTPSTNTTTTTSDTSSKVSPEWAMSSSTSEPLTRLYLGNSRCFFEKATDQTLPPTSFEIDSIRIKNALCLNGYQLSWAVENNQLTGGDQIGSWNMYTSGSSLALARRSMDGTYSMGSDTPILFAENGDLVNVKNLCGGYWDVQISYGAIRYIASGEGNKGIYSRTGGRIDVSYNINVEIYDGVPTSVKPITFYVTTPDIRELDTSTFGLVERLARGTGIFYHRLADGSGTQTGTVRFSADNGQPGKLLVECFWETIPFLPEGKMNIIGSASFLYESTANSSVSIQRPNLLFAPS